MWLMLKHCVQDACRFVRNPAAGFNNNHISEAPAQVWASALLLYCGLAAAAKMHFLRTLSASAAMLTFLQHGACSAADTPPKHLRSAVAMMLLARAVVLSGACGS
jgi:hypothetical protein